VEHIFSRGGGAVKLKSHQQKHWVRLAVSCGPGTRCFSVHCHLQFISFQRCVNLFATSRTLWQLSNPNMALPPVTAEIGDWLFMQISSLWINHPAKLSSGLEHSEYHQFLRCQCQCRMHVYFVATHNDYLRIFPKLRYDVYSVETDVSVYLVCGLVKCCWLQNSKSIDLDVVDSSLSKLDFIKEGSVLLIHMIFVVI